MTPLLSSRLSRCRTVAAPSCTLLLAVVAAVSTASPTADRPLRESAPSFFRGKQIHRPASRPWRSEVALEIGKWPTAAAAGCARWSDAGTDGSDAQASVKLQPVDTSRTISADELRELCVDFQAAAKVEVTPVA